jgi:hypothetical protein
MRGVRAALIVSLVCAGPLRAAEPASPALRWLRGTTHVHTALSDGDASPLVVASWYRDHGYDFVVITDHDSLTPVDRLNRELGGGGRFLVLGGVEVTDRLGRAPVHLNGIGVREAVKPGGGGSVAEILDRNARAVRAAGGIPQVNHPNYVWAFGADEIAASTEPRHLEIFNGHPAVNNEGGGGTPSAEEMWDALLSRGRTFYAMATDDAHDFHGEFSRHLANPGRGWVTVRAPALTAEAILAALDRGDFYASTGVEITDMTADARGIRLRLPRTPAWQANPSRPLDLRYRTVFIGRDGRVLDRDDSLEPAYVFRGDELYVRARVEASDGTRAWTQPVFPARRP